MTDKVAYIGASIQGENGWQKDAALLIDGDQCAGVVKLDEIGNDFKIIDLGGGILVPGFVDLQVNGGGGVLLNEQPTCGGIRTICNAHRQFGTTALLPTLITDTPDITKRAIDAGIEAQQNQVAGFLGLHLEGPHLSVAKKGAHSPELIRPMSDEDISSLCDAKAHLDNMLVTVAPESVDTDQISALAKTGIRVSLGHTAATAENAKKFFAAGATSVTHLYNAMSGLTHREPGLVGAALNNETIFCGLIADGFHVMPDAINIALKMKDGEGKLFLVTDAMSTIGTDQTEFTLNGRTILRSNGRLTLEDGTLAGADLDMISAVRFMATQTRCGRDEALRMASLYPSEYMGVSLAHGQLSKGAFANFMHLDEQLQIQSIWQMGNKAA